MEHTTPRRAATSRPRKPSAFTPGHADSPGRNHRSADCSRRRLEPGHRPYAAGGAVTCCVNRHLRPRGHHVNATRAGAAAGVDLVPCPMAAPSFRSRNTTPDTLNCDRGRSEDRPLPADRETFSHPEILEPHAARATSPSCAATSSGSKAGAGHDPRPVGPGCQYATPKPPKEHWKSKTLGGGQPRRHTCRCLREDRPPPRPRPRPRRLR